MYIYNTLTKKKEIFEPIEYPFVRIYHCGITPYEKSHVGHLRSEIALDVIRRTLRFLGYVDIAISNFTDIDDKIINKAKEEEKIENWHEIPKRNIKYHLEVIKKINNLPFYINPLVTEHIEDIEKFIKDLIRDGYAYFGKYSIYFDVDKFSEYGKLSGNLNKDLWNQEIDLIQDKKHPYDFALWKFKKEGEPYWITSIGEGRPGWHIECSTMSSKYLGIQFDIHSGGQDLIFPHHENEIAQSESRYKVKPWVKYWIHFGYLTVNGQKMSKSLKNIIPADEFINLYGPMSSRFFLISVHYRDPIDLNENSINQAIENYNYITSTIKTVITTLYSLDRTFKLDNEDYVIWKKLLEYEKKFIYAILDDIDTTLSTSILLEATRFINKEVINKKVFTLYYTAYEFYNVVNKIYAVWDDIFYGKKENMEILNNLIELIIEIRNKLRERKDYEISDYIRSRLRNIGIDLIDFKDKSYYRFI